jgi:hypothetical protein
MESTLRKHITLPESTFKFLSEYQQREGLPNFSATVEAAAKALQRQVLISGYQQFAEDYANSASMQQEAENWLNPSMEEM